MNNKEKAKAQQALDLLAQLIDVTGASGKAPHNRIIGFKLIERKGGTDMFGRPLMDGRYVRPIWSDNPTRDDGYYDINVDGDSPWGAIIDVIKEMQRRF